MASYPTSTCIHVATVALLGAVVGVALRAPAVVAWCGALLIGLALARAVTLLSVARIRAAGFEMLWTASGRAVQLSRGASIELETEIRNRDSLAARFDHLRVVASPGLAVDVDVCAGEVPAGGSIAVKVRVQALRVGYHGIHSLSLELRGAPGLFEVPLSFANPFGVEVIPARAGRQLRLPPGGGQGANSHAGRAGKGRGDGGEFRELRDYLPGDPFRRVAWKASARRGKLLVRQFDCERRDDIWLVLDASVEHWAGEVGLAPLDAAIESVAGLARRHLGVGDRVGLVVLAGRELVSIAPDHGPGHFGRLVAALIAHTDVRAADRCAWDEARLALEIAEHIRPLDPRASLHFRRRRMDRMLRRVARVMKQRAPFARPVPYGRSAADASLRHYAACFGLNLPMRSEPDGSRAFQVMASCLNGLALRTRRREGAIHVVAPAPRADDWRVLKTALRRLRSHGLSLRWSFFPQAVVAKTAPGSVERSVRATVVERAVLGREALAESAARRQLRRLGVVVVKAARQRGVRPEATDRAAAQVEERVA